MSRDVTSRPNQHTRSWTAAATAVATLAVLVCCPAAASPAPPAAATAASPAAGTASAPTPAAGAASAPPPAKVMVIAEENHTYDEVVGSPAAPYLSRLAATYASATTM